MCIDFVKRNGVKVSKYVYLTTFSYILINGFFILLGVWFMHCHLEVHTTWGLKMAFVVDNGKGPNESLIPPPSDFPKC
jgi:hypothetical protein